MSRTEKINEIYYNRAASSYERTVRIHDEGNKVRIRRILSTIIRRPDSKILDVCCGVGLYLSVLKDFVKPENLHGIDISPEMLKLSGRYCQNVQKASVYELPFPEASFDLVTCSSALHHLEHLDRALSEISRVLKPDGLFLSDYDNNVYFARYDAWRRRLTKAFLVYPILLKVFGRGTAGRDQEELVEKELESLSDEELHRLAEHQNLHHDGIHPRHLSGLLRKAGFEDIQIYTFHSYRWNDGEKCNLFTSLSNNKIYSISRKTPSA